MQLIFLLPGQDGNVAAILNNINVHFFYGEIMNTKISKELFKLSNKAYKKNEIPVSALILKSNKIIAKAYNQKNIKRNSLYHAEILCLLKSFKKLKRWNLSDCEMYVTLEPCDMCKEAISEARIKKVYYILKKGNITNKYNKTIYEQMYDINKEKFQKNMSKIFNKIR